MLQESNIKIMLFTILCICLVFYIFLGIYSFKKDKQSKVNISFFTLCIAASCWALGYASMLISPNIEIANRWRIFSSVGWCFFNAVWISFAFSLKDINQNQNNNSSKIVQTIMYIVSMIFFIINFTYPASKVVGIESYGFVDSLFISTTPGTVFSIYIVVLYLAAIVLIFQMRTSPKNRIRKQVRTIIITTFISFGLMSITDLILPSIGILIFPSGIISISIGMGGMWYAINKHKLMSVSDELLSHYLFEAANEPIFILGEDFLIKSCNSASLEITGFNNEDLNQNSLKGIIDFGKLNFHTIVATGNLSNVEINLHRKNKDSLVCELSATIILDEYNDILGILVLLHDVSERKKMLELQSKYTLQLENEIRSRKLAEEQLKHFVYFDTLTELSNRKKMLEDIGMLIDKKNEKFAILFIDLDKFKSANDKYSHEAGDEVLKNVALRLKSIVRSTDAISRIGGDEFIIVVRNLKTSANAEKIAEAILETLSRSFTYKNNQLFIGASIGISIFPEHGSDISTLINNADVAMYEVKDKGGNGYKIYSPALKEENKLSSKQ